MRRAYRWWLGGALLYSLFGLWLLVMMTISSSSFVFSLVHWLWPFDLLWFFWTLYIVYLLIRSRAPFLFYLFPGYYLLSYVLLGFEIFFLPHSFLRSTSFSYILVSSIFEFVVAAGFLWYLFWKDSFPAPVKKSGKARTSYKKFANASRREQGKKRKKKKKP